MAKELPILPSTVQPADGTQAEPSTYSRVFCQKENSPPLRLLIDFLKSRGQNPIVPDKLGPDVLDDWTWLQIPLGYSQGRKPITVFCVRDRGSYKELFEQEQGYFRETLSIFDEVEAQLMLEFVNRARFILTTQMNTADVTEEGYDFNGWILQFFQENCNGVVQVDGQGFFSPGGELVVDLSSPSD
ncbi:MAG TPA: hypothetical protein VH681_08695 [Nitrospiraceae bacterium]|jgi:hypothetical protein